MQEKVLFNIRSSSIDLRIILKVRALNFADLFSLSLLSYALGLLPPPRRARAFVFLSYLSNEENDLNG